MFYFLNIVIVLYNIILYSIFRVGVYSFLRLSKMSKTNIKKNRKGLKNYWLYHSINKQTPLGILYYINIVFLTFTIVFSLLIIFLGFVQVLQPVFFIISIALCGIEIPATILASIYNYKAEFGRSFVLIAWSKDRKRFCSSIADMFSWGVTVFLIYISYVQIESLFL